MTMNEPSYDYYGLLASTWDLWRGDTSMWSDRTFFLDVVQRFGEPVLDVGCGTGRILLDYAALGIDIDGIDNSPEMLAICRSKAEKAGISPTLYQKDIELLELPRRYRTIVAPSSAFQLIPDPDRARATLARIFSHLQPGGAFVSPFFFDWREGEPLDTGWDLLFERVRPEDGATVRHFIHEWQEPQKQLWHTESRFEVEQDGQLIATEHQRRSPEGRWYTQTQAVKLYRNAGFTDIQLFREFERVPASWDDRCFSALGVKP
jgi:ubiquinone/menaquinone biosynthesis C-methylase UbiE